MKQREYRVFVQDVGKHGYSGFKNVMADSARDAVRKVKLGRRETGLEDVDFIARLENSKPNYGLEDHGMEGLQPRKRKQGS